MTRIFCYKALMINTCHSVTPYSSAKRASMHRLQTDQGSFIWDHQEVYSVHALWKLRNAELKRFIREDCMSWLGLHVWISLYQPPQRVKHRHIAGMIFFRKAYCCSTSFRWIQCGLISHIDVDVFAINQTLQVYSSWISRCLSVKSYPSPPMF